MIGKITIGKSFRGCLMYCLNDKRKQFPDEVIFKNRAEIIAFNKCNGTAHDLIKQFNQVKQLNPKLAKPVLHITLSMAPGEHLSNDKLMEVSEQCAKDFGFENNQYVSVLHKDTEHQHMHVIANRIGLDKKTVSDSNSYKRVATFCRKMELNLNLQQVQSPQQFLSDKQQIRPSQDKRKMMIKQHVKEALFKSANYQDFARLMKEKNYHVIKGRGIAFIDDKKVYVKGSEIGFSLQTIAQILAQQNERTFLHQPPPSLQKSVNDIGNSISPKQNNINEETSKSSELSNAVNKTIEELIDPKEMNDYLPHQLQQKKKKKQQRIKF